MMLMFYIIKYTVNQILLKKAGKKVLKKKEEGIKVLKQNGYLKNTFFIHKILNLLPNKVIRPKEPSFLSALAEKEQRVLSVWKVSFHIIQLMTEKVDPKALKAPKDVVAQDRNWTLRVNSELEAQGKWNNQWGYYAKGFSPEKASTQKRETIDDRIQQLEQQVDEIDGKVFQTTSSAYGKGDNVEVYKDKKYNIQENHDLRALQRRLPKDWKKAKWTPPVDPFDPLSKMGKKK